MKRVGILAFLMVLVITGGVISSGMLDAPLSGLLIVQSTDPNASPFSAPPQQAMQIVVWVGFVLFNIVGFALTLALFFWLMNRSLARNRAGTGATPAATDKTTE